jgi:type I restriction enzyme M protein
MSGSDTPPSDTTPTDADLDLATLTAEPIESASPSEEGGVAAQLVDYVSGKLVRATPEEVDAVQVFSKRLVEELGYPKALLQTRPQFRVRSRPSATTHRGYPVDIAVFSSLRRLDEDAFIVVECKKKTRRDGEEQLKIYLTMSPAPIGVWFNGQDHIYLLKRYQSDG